jgi:hypothetical protein
MVGLKMSTEENLVKEKEQNMFYFTRKKQDFHRGCVTTRHIVLSHCP